MPKFLTSCYYFFANGTKAVANKHKQEKFIEVPQFNILSNKIRLTYLSNQVSTVFITAKCYFQTAYLFQVHYITNNLQKILNMTKYDKQNKNICWNWIKMPKTKQTFFPQFLKHTDKSQKH